MPSVQNKIGRDRNLYKQQYRNVPTVGDMQMQFFFSKASHIFFRRTPTTIEQGWLREKYRLHTCYDNFASEALFIVNVISELKTRLKNTDSRYHLPCFRLP